MSISCLDCSTPIPIESISLQQMAAVCPACAHVFRLTSSFLEGSHQSGHLELPKGFEVHQELSTLRLSISWRAVRRKGALTLIAIAWDLLLAPWIWAALFVSIKVALLVSLPFLIGLGLTIHVLALWINSTEIRVDNKSIEVRHRPVPDPFIATFHFPIRDIAHIFVQRYVPSHTNDRPNMAFGLCCKTKDGKRLMLVSGFTDASGALYLEQEIGKFLGIPVRSV